MVPKSWKCSEWNPLLKPSESSLDFLAFKDVPSCRVVAAIGKQRYSRVLFGRLAQFGRVSVEKTQNVTGSIPVSPSNLGVEMTYLLYILFYPVVWLSRKIEKWTRISLTL